MVIINLVVTIFFIIFADMFYNIQQIEFLYKRLIDLTVPTEFRIENNLNTVLNSTNGISFINSLNLIYLKDEFLDILELFIHYHNYDPYFRNNIIEALYNVLLRDTNKTYFTVKISFNTINSYPSGGRHVVKHYNMLIMLSGVTILNNDFDVIVDDDELKYIVGRYGELFSGYGYYPDLFFNMIKRGKGENSKMLLYCGLFEHRVMT